MVSRQSRKLVFLTCVCGTLVATIGHGQSVPSDGNWTQWRGPNRDNRSPERGLLKQWPKSGPPLAWKAEGLGRGIASIAVDDGRIFTVGYHFPGSGVIRTRPGRTRPTTRTEIPQGEYMVALDANSGQLIWATRLGNAVFENHLMRWLSQRTPTVDGSRVYVLTADGVLVCLRSRDGFEHWRRSYTSAFGGIKSRWGYCDYPLVDGDHLICTPGGPDATVVALNKYSGELIWKCSVPDAKGHGHAATIVNEAGGLRHYIALTQSGLIGVSADDGTLLWKYDRYTRSMNAITPILHDDKILCFSSYRGRSISRLGVDRVDSGLRITEELHSPLKEDVINAFQDNILMWDGHLYATGRSPGGLACIDANSLEVVWSQGGLVAGQRSPRGTSGMAFADEHIYVRYGDGAMTLVAPQRDGYLERGMFTIPDSKRSVGVTMPVIAGGHLLLRDDERLLCYDIREKREPTPRKSSVVRLDLSGFITTDAQDPPSEQGLRSVFVATPHDVVDRMLELANVKHDDVLCDLGSGDGRIVIAAAKQFGCSSIGYELSKDLISDSRRTAKAAGVEQLTTFENVDIFQADLGSVTVLTLYLLPEQNRRLLPQLEKLPPGSRIVAHQNPIPGLRPDRVMRAETGEDGDVHTLYLWTTPLNKTFSDQTLDK